MGLTGFFKGFWGYVSGLQWWQGAIIIFIVLVTILLGSFWKKIISWIGNRITRASRTCGDCILLLFSKEAIYTSERKKITEHILDTQMIFASHKLDSLYLSMITSYRKDIVAKRGPNYDISLENKEMSWYKEALHNAFDDIKKEVRRSFKENGFHELSGKLFSEYAKNISRHLIDIGKAYMIDKYPSDMIVPIEERLDSLDENGIDDIVFDVYMNAKDVRIEAVAKAQKIDDDFKTEINEFVKNKR